MAASVLTPSRTSCQCGTLCFVDLPLKPIQISRFFTGHSNLSPSEVPINYKAFYYRFWYLVKPFYTLDSIY